MSSKDSTDAMHANDTHNKTVNSQDAVPGADAEHAHSHAAHLHDGGFDSKLPPQGNVPAGMRQGQREPPEEAVRTSKGQHRA